MFLLILACSSVVWSGSLFTFHYVSTYTMCPRMSLQLPVSIYIPLCFYLYKDADGNRPDIYINLHSTMFLLILQTSYTPLSDILIYIPLCFYLYDEKSAQKVAELHLHSTMFLLILIYLYVLDESFEIYIPLCFYLYAFDSTACCSFIFIYIPLCFYLYCDIVIIHGHNHNLHSTMFLLIRIFKFLSFSS